MEDQRQEQHEEYKNSAESVSIDVTHEIANDNSFLPILQGEETYRQAP